MEDVQPILQDGAISANWFMVAIMAICAFLLIRMLNKMDKRADAHAEKLDEHTTMFGEQGKTLAVHEQRLDNHDEILKRS